MTSNNSSSSSNSKAYENPFYKDHMDAQPDHDEALYLSELRKKEAELPDGYIDPDMRFPLRLHRLLHCSEVSEIISWQPHGRSFKVHDPHQFLNDVLPTYFRQSKLASFNRQLNIYGFRRISRGRDRGGYFHPCFLRQKEFLCFRIQRTEKKGKGKGRHHRPIEEEPDFYKMKFTEPISAKDAPTFSLFATKQRLHNANQNKVAPAGNSNTNIKAILMSGKKPTVSPVPEESLSSLQSSNNWQQQQQQPENQASVVEEDEEQESTALNGFLGYNQNQLLECMAVLQTSEQFISNSSRIVSQQDQQQQGKQPTVVASSSPALTTQMEYPFAGNHQEQQRANQDNFDTSWLEPRPIQEQHKQQQSSSDFAVHTAVPSCSSIQPHMDFYIHEPANANARWQPRQEARNHTNAFLANNFHPVTMNQAMMPPMVLSQPQQDRTTGFNNRQDSGWCQDELTFWLK